MMSVTPLRTTVWPAYFIAFSTHVSLLEVIINGIGMQTYDEP